MLVRKKDRPKQASGDSDSEKQKPREALAQSGLRIRHGFLTVNNRAHFEDRHIHGNNETTDDHPEECNH